MIDKGDGHLDRFLRNLNSHHGIALFRMVGIAGNIDENLFHSHIDLHLGFHRAIRCLQMLIHKSLDLIQIFIDCLQFQLCGMEYKGVIFLEQIKKLCFPVIDLRASLFRLQTVPADGASDHTGISDNAGLVFYLTVLPGVSRSQISSQRLVPEGQSRLCVKALELFDNLRIHLGKSPEGIVHGSQLENGMAHRQRIHINQKNLIILQFQIFRVIVPVNHMIILGHFLHHGQELLSGLFRQIVQHKSGPADSCLLHIRQLSGRNLCPVDLFEHIHIFLHAPVHLFRLGSQNLGEGTGVEELEYRPVAVSHLDHIIGNGCRNAQDQSQLCYFPLMLDIRKRVRIIINFYYIVLVNPVNGTVGTAADLLTALNGNQAVGLFHRHHLGKACHIQDLIDL